MKKDIISILFIIALFGNGVIYAQNFEWVKSFGSASPEMQQVSWAITTDASGNVYITGSGRGTIDFDPGTGVGNLNLDADGDIFVLKLDANGSFLWARTFGSNTPGITEIGYSIVTDPSGNVYTIGIFAGTVDFNPGPGTYNLTSVGLADIFLQKLDSNGNFLWAKSFGADDYEYGYDIVLDLEGSIYTTGYFSGTADFDPDVSATYYLEAEGQTDAFIQKLDSNGNLVWARSFGGQSQFDTNPASIAVDELGNSYAAGTFSGNVDFDPGINTNNQTSSGGVDSFIEKLDASGNFVWAKTFGGAGQDYITSVELDHFGNIYTTGAFEGTVDLDPGIGIDNHNDSGNSDPFIQKLDSNGDLLWAKSYGGYVEFLMSIAVDSSGNVYSSGTFNGSVDFDPGNGSTILTSHLEDDFYIQKLDSDGNFLWAETFGGDDQDWCKAIDIDHWGNIYTTGFFAGTMDFNNGPGVSNLTPLGYHDAYILKLNQSTASINDQKEEIKLIAFPNPSNGIIRLSTEETLSNVELSLTDMQGKNILAQSYDQLKNTTIELPDAKGIYFLHVQTLEGKLTLKLVKEQGL